MLRCQRNKFNIYVTNMYLIVLISYLLVDYLEVWI